MRNIKNILSVLVMIIVLAAGVYLVKTSQDTRRGATQSESSSTISPDTISANVGENLVTTLILNTGSATDELSAAEIKVAFDRTKLKYVGTEVLSPFTMVNAADSVDGGTGPLTLNMLSLNEYRSGAVIIAKITFQALESGASEVKASGNIVLKGAASWTLATNNGSAVTVGGVAAVTEKYSGLDGFVYGSTMLQSLVDYSGTKSWYRRCPIENDSVAWNKCTIWELAELSNLRGEGGESYKGLSAVVTAGGTSLIQSLVGSNGQDSWYRTCPVNSTGVLWNNCNKNSSGQMWNFSDMRNLRGAGNEKYSAMDGFVFNDKYMQSFIDIDGQKSWYRTCPVRGGVIVWGECSGYSFVDVSNLRGQGGERYGAMSAFSVNNKVVYQSLVDANGMDSWYRVCPIDSNGIQWNNCNKDSAGSIWNYVDLRNARNTVAPQMCSRCSTFYENQKVKWQAVNCNLPLGPGVAVERTYDATCTNPSNKRFNCQRCSTVNNKEYVWWEPEAGSTDCSVVPTGATIYRSFRDDCTTTGVAVDCSTLNTIGKCGGNSNCRWWACSDSCKSLSVPESEACVVTKAFCNSFATEDACTLRDTLGDNGGCAWYSCSNKCWPRGTSTSEACATEDECSSNSECPMDKACVNGSCVVPTCAGTGTACQKASYANHVCTFVKDTSKEGASCQYNSVTAGKCTNGVCVRISPTEDGCSSNSQCPMDKSCINGECVAPSCSGTGNSCQKATYANHLCTFSPDTNKDGTSCQYNSVTTGKCLNGVCLEPTKIPDGKKKLSFKTAYRGFVAGAKCGLNEKLKVVVRSSNGEMTSFENVAVNNGLSEIVINAGKDMALFVKGSQHLQMKYSVDGQDSRYTQAGGKIETIDNKVYDFTKYPMLPGDVDGDGWINGRDFSIVKTKAMKYEEVAEGGFLNGDFDGSCQVNTRDLTLLVNSLDEKQDELY